MPRHSLTYGFAPTGGCGAATSAGKNTNRTSLSDNGATATTYCYDGADRLTSSSDTAVGTPVYDAHGNTKTLGAQTLAYDQSDRHVSTVAGTTTVTYVRDANRIISRTEAGTTVRYGFAGDGDSAAFTTDPTNVVVYDRTLGLVGGVTLTKRLAADVWSYPNLHGDVVATADASGTKQGPTLAYDLFGQAVTAPGPSDPDGVPDNSAGNFDYGWLGQAQRLLEHAPGITTVEMGARPYVPGMGRFLGVDPVEGGSANDYDYANGDLVNGFDLSGASVGDGNIITYLAAKDDSNLGGWVPLALREGDDYHVRGKTWGGSGWSDVKGEFKRGQFGTAETAAIRSLGGLMTVLAINSRIPGWSFS